MSNGLKANFVNFKSDGIWHTLLDLIYPVGTYYFSEKKTSPASLFGGVWTPVIPNDEEDRFLYIQNPERKLIPEGGSNEAVLPIHTHEFTSPTYAFEGIPDGGHTHKVTIDKDSTRHFHEFETTASNHSHKVTVPVGNHSHNVTINIPRHNHTVSAIIPKHGHTFSNGKVASHSHTFSGTGSHKHSHNHDHKVTKFDDTELLRYFPSTEQSGAKWVAGPNVRDIANKAGLSTSTMYYYPVVKPDKKREWTNNPIQNIVNTYDNTESYYYTGTTTATVSGSTSTAAPSVTGTISEKAATQLFSTTSEPQAVSASVPLSSGGKTTPPIEAMDTTVTSTYQTSDISVVGNTEFESLDLTTLVDSVENTPKGNILLKTEGKVQQKGVTDIEKANMPLFTGVYCWKRLA